MTEISVWLTLKDEANLTTVLTGIKNITLPKTCKLRIEVIEFFSSFNSE